MAWVFRPPFIAPRPTQRAYPFGPRPALAPPFPWKVLAEARAAQHRLLAEPRVRFILPPPSQPHIFGPRDAGPPFPWPASKTFLQTRILFQPAFVPPRQTQGPFPWGPRPPLAPPFPWDVLPEARAAQHPLLVARRDRFILPPPIQVKVPFGPRPALAPPFPWKAKGPFVQLWRLWQPPFIAPRVTQRMIPSVAVVVTPLSFPFPAPSQLSMSPIFRPPFIPPRKTQGYMPGSIFVAASAVGEWEMIPPWLKRRRIATNAI